MDSIIQQLGANMLEEMISTILECGLKMDKSIDALQRITKQYSLKVMQHLIEETDKILQEDKVGRRQAGWVVERYGDKRAVMTEIGEIQYQRTYYRNNETREYKYLVDSIIEVTPYMRVGTSLSQELVTKSRRESFQKAVENACNGALSKQTVLNKVRKAKPVIEIPSEKKQVLELHIDADEDHVALQDKDCKARTIVPLISVYEGIEKCGTRNICKNIFHISSYGEDADTIWENALTRIEQLYDLTNTKIYLHGDGASWIAKGMEWLPNATFVLDMYHKNKYVQHLLAGYAKEKIPQLRKNINQALVDMDKEYFENIVEQLIAYSPMRETKIKEAAAYLSNHMPDIAIRNTDLAACNGGATEPHISHVLSSRLSSRPKAWSKETLEVFTPILANGPNVYMTYTEPLDVQPVALNALKQARSKLSRNNGNSTFQSSLMITQMGKKTQLYQALSGLVRNRMC
ncbi:MAG: ISLre2 family transposase [Clostridia bacterium]